MVTRDLKRSSSWPKYLPFISRMLSLQLLVATWRRDHQQTNQVTIRKSCLRTRFHDVTHCLYLTTLTKCDAAIRYLWRLAAQRSWPVRNWFSSDHVEPYLWGLVSQTRKPSCRWQTRATLAKSLHGLCKTNGVVSCIARLPIDSVPMVSYYVLYSNCVCKMHRFGDTRLLKLPWPRNPGQGSLKVM